MGTMLALRAGEAMGEARLSVAWLASHQLEANVRRAGKSPCLFVKVIRIHSFCRIDQ